MDCVEEGGTYLFTNLRIKENYYTSEKLLNTAKNGFQVEQAPPFDEDLPEVQPSLANLSVKETKVSIIGIKTVSTYFSCRACSKKLEKDENLMKCTSCKLKQKANPTTKQFYARIFVEDVARKSDTFYLSFFNNHIQKLLQTQGKEIPALASETMLTDILLDCSDITIKHHINGNVIDIITQDN